MPCAALPAACSGSLRRSSSPLLRLTSDFAWSATAKRKKKKGGWGRGGGHAFWRSTRRNLSVSTETCSSVSSLHPRTHSLTRAQRQQAAATTAVDNRPVLPAQWSPPTVDGTGVAHCAVVTQVPTRGGEELGGSHQALHPPTSNSASQGDAPSRHLQTD